MECRRHFRQWFTQPLLVLLIASLTIILLSSASLIGAITYYFLSVIHACNIPDIDPFDASILPYVHPPDNYSCSSHDPLSYTSHQDGRHVLRIRQDVLQQHYDTPLGNLECFYSVITRKTDETNTEGEFIKFENEALLDSSVEFLYVKCLDNRTHQNQIYNNMHAVVMLKSSLNLAPFGRDEEDIGLEAMRPNVLILGIDGVSRLNFKRTMMQTESYLKGRNWIGLRKYNKVGDNTYPNLMALLTGKNEEQLGPIGCWPNKGTNHDHCPFIWKDFNSKGYVTSYAEDEAALSTFHWHTDYEGFIKQPTDYYLRPFVLAAQGKLHVKIRERFHVCLGPTSTVDIFLKYTKDLLETFSNSLFALTWLNNFSHDNLTLPEPIDKTFVAYIEGLHESGILKNTIVIFISDHGVRFGPIRVTYMGWLEERLPFAYIWVPDWFKAKYPDAYQNLVDNGDRLTSPYDLYLTMMDVATGGIGEHSSGSGGCAKCASLFTPIADERSCDDAGVPQQWCACSRQTEVKTTGEVVPGATQWAVDYLNQMLANHSACAELKLNKILSARIQENRPDEDDNGFHEYVLVFETEPGLALFEATVKYNAAATKPFQLVGDMISRINSYGNTSACVRNEKTLKLYCFCI